MLDWIRTRVVGWTPTGRALGAAGERVARRTLRRRGHKVLLSNYRTRRGELDIVTLGPDRRTIVIVEVKTRLEESLRVSGVTVRPEEAITRRKAHKLLALAAAAVLERGWGGRPVRIDVVAVDWDPRGRHAVRHYENAVTMSDW